MEKEICDYYKPIGFKNRICKHFTGDKESKRQKNLCRHNCDKIKPTKRNKVQ